MSLSTLECALTTRPGSVLRIERLLSDDEIACEIKRDAYLDGQQIPWQQAEWIVDAEIAARRGREASALAVSVAASLGYPGDFA